MHGCNDDDDAGAAQEQTSTKCQRWQERPQLHGKMCATKTPLLTQMEKHHELFTVLTNQRET